MQETLIVTFLFWCTFVFSAGPFWIATMEAAPHTTFQKLYSNYVLYLLVGWLPVLLATSLFSGFIANLGTEAMIAMHLIGGLYILYLAIKVLKAKLIKGTAFDFNWWNMALVTYFNPKVYLLLPIGFLTANISSELAVNIAFFYFSGIPVFLFGVFFWGTIGRIGARISLNYISYFNAGLLALFGAFLIYKGAVLLMF